ncbi:LytR/AlgR family response regulator transcription factor [Spirosoma soli]|uniref:LytR/AlgR family response regulator transcription factor n=1 Tax=Spirosoma soli TaxID=1770529 RepID=A0ABW5M2J4_9BACT
MGKPATVFGHPDYIYVRADYTVYKITLADILFIEGLDDYLKMHLESTRHPIVAHMTMKAMLYRLRGADALDSPFIRVHRSYIVTFNRIEGVRNKVIPLAGRDIPIGASYESNVRRCFLGQTKSADFAAYTFSATIRAKSTY